MKCIVLAGGSGGSLWPLSRKNYPIQFVEIREGRSVFQENIARHLPYCDEFYIFTNSRYEYIVEGQLEVFQELKYKLFLEKEAVNTTLPVLLGLMFAENENVLVIGCSSLFSGNGFRESFNAGLEVLKNNSCVLFGMAVTGHNTNIGYIKHTDNNVDFFIEKPDYKLLCELLKNGEWLCNTGKYLINSNEFLKQIQREFPQIYSEAEGAFKIYRNRRGNIVISSKFDTDVLKCSFERSIISNMSNAGVVELKNVQWNIVSDWKSIEKAIKKNALTDVVKEDCSNVTVINNTENKLVVANGINNAVIISTDDAIYVEGSNADNDIKGFFINHEDNHAQYINYNNSRYRIWGKYTILNRGKGYIVKEVIVFPGKEMSRHRHIYRSEHWAVVEGTVEITINKKTAEYGENTSVFVPCGSYHKIANRTNKNVVIIETEIGSYINENDIEPENSVSENSKINSIIKLKPAFKDYLWGGTRLRDEFNKECSWDVIAESWEMSTHSAGNSVIDSGEYAGMEFGEFIKKFGEKVTGWKCSAFNKFPILIKLIDSKNPLSVQVHPDDDFAMAAENEYGKNEMWYIVDCDEDAFIYCGFNRDITVDEFKEHIKNKTITDVLNKIYVKKGEAYFIPAGTVHAIGKGILICEIQQNSNSTYRIYDYDRKDKNGRQRDLHIDKALKVMNMNRYLPYEDISGMSSADENSNVKKLCACKYFEAAVMNVKGSAEFYVDNSSFAAVVVTEGEGIVSSDNSEMEIKKGDTLFLPADLGNVCVTGNCMLIVTHI